MTENPAVLVTVCARGGSKGVPNKNVRTVAGEPLVAHSIRQALAWERADDVVVSTDDDRIAEVAEDCGARVPFRRPAPLASDEAAKLPVIQHAVECVEESDDTRFDYVVDLGATTPIRLVDDIEDCFLEVVESDASNGYTVTEADENPYFNVVELDEHGYAHLSKSPDGSVVRRQDAPDVFAINGSVYVYERDYLEQTDSLHAERTTVSVMPRRRSVDVDEPIDLEYLRFLMEERGIEYE